MASSSIFILVLQLLIFEVAQELGVQQQTALSHAVLGDKSNDLEKLRNAMNECLRVQKLSRGALTELVKALPQEIHGMKQKIDHKDEMEQMLIEYIKDLKVQLKRQHTRADRLTGTNAELLVKISEKHKQVEKQVASNAELLDMLSDKDRQMQDLNKKLLELNEQVLSLKNYAYQMDQALENLAVTTNLTLECTHPRQEEINILVQEFISTRQWMQLRKGLLEVLDNCSMAYKQLQKNTNTYPIWYIGNHGYVQLAKVLLCGGMDIDFQDTDGDTMLLGTADGDKLTMAKVLVDNGADINRKGRHGWTPLIISTNQGFLDMVQWLVREGANTANKDEKGQTALDLAEQNGMTDIAKYLERFPH